MNSRKPNPLRQHLVIWALLLVFWLLMMLAFAGQMVLAGSIPWSTALSAAFRDWYPWALLSPVVIYLSAKFPFEKGKLALSVPVHISACVLAVLVHQELTRPLGPLNPLPPARPEQPPRPPQAGEDPHWAPRGAGGPRRGPGPPEGGGPPMDLLNSPGEIRHRPAWELFSRRAQFNVPIYWIIVSIAHAFGYWRRLKEREQAARILEAQLTEARLETLRNQLHPHFLFNTLHAISTLVHKDPDAADEMITNLSELLRSALDTSNAQEVSLQRDLELLAPYIQIQEVRLGKRLKVEQEIEPAAARVKVPALLLQPLLENAVRHGIEPREEGGKVIIRARLHGSELKIQVADDGLGLNQQVEVRNGIGLANTRARLDTLYRGKARLELSNAPGGGCVVEVTIPVEPVAEAVL